MASVRSGNQTSRNRASFEEGNTEEKWMVFQTSITETADELLGRATSSHPDWFRDSMDYLKPLLDERNAAYVRWLKTHKTEDHLSFKNARSVAKRGIRRAKNNWFQDRAEEAERERFGGKKVWKCIRDMQHGRKGLQPSKIININDENGTPCKNSEEQHQCWRRHFNKVLNVNNQFDELEVERVSEREVDDTLGRIPSTSEVTKALGELKNGKAPGSSDILPEMLKAGKKE